MDQEHTAALGVMVEVLGEERELPAARRIGVAGLAVPHHVHHAELAERLVVQRDAGRAVVLDIRAPAGRA
ncbi:MAG: hypothetical protein ACMG6S_31205 [Byssovorax sp.]